MSVRETFGQSADPVRFDWGLAGALATRSAGTDVVVIVDVLSFTTSVCVAVERGTAVYPYAWGDDRADAYADQLGAGLAIGRLEAVKAGSTVPSLSPARLLRADLPARLVLPSPNGSSIAAALSDPGPSSTSDRHPILIAGCLRNAEAVASRLTDELSHGRSVAMIAAGERWPDDSMRPALEDLLGAGAILAALDTSLSDVAPETLSPEAHSAADAFRAVAASGHLESRMRSCVSGRELTDRGFADDVAVAAEMNTSAVVPVLSDGAFG